MILRFTPKFFNYWLMSCLLLPAFAAYSQNTSPDKPNVLFITADDMCAWSVLNNYPVLKAPNIKKLFSQSYYFSNASCAAPVCVPSRASFFSGMYPHHSGVYNNGPNVWGTSELLKQIEAIPECFQHNGYETWGRGKTFHVKLPGTREDDMFDNKVYNGGFGPFTDKAHLAVKNHWYGIQPWGGPDSDFPDVINTDSAVAYLAQKHDRPFFMYLGIYRPHSPYTSPKRFFDMYDENAMPLPPGYLKNDLDDVPAMGKELSDGMRQLQTAGYSREQIWRKYLKAYCAGYTFSDWNLGRVMEALDKSPYFKNTIVVFCADNGFHNGTKDHWTKSTLWEQADGVPLMIRLPNGKAYKCPQTVSLIDIYPTLLEYCHINQPKQKLDGISMVPILKDPKYKWARPGLTTYGEGYASIRTEKYRYIHYPDGTEELYNQLTDPYEHTNLAGKPEMKSVKAELAKSIPDHFQKSVPSKRPNKANGKGKKGDNEGDDG